MRGYETRIYGACPELLGSLSAFLRAKITSEKKRPTEKACEDGSSPLSPRKERIMNTGSGRGKRGCQNAFLCRHVAKGEQQNGSDTIKGTKKHVSRPLRNMLGKLDFGLFCLTCVFVLGSVRRKKISLIFRQQIPARPCLFGDRPDTLFGESDPAY